MKIVNFSDTKLWAPTAAYAQKCGYKTDISANLRIENSLHDPAFDITIFDASNLPSKSDLFAEYNKRYKIDIRFGIRFSECTDMVQAVAQEKEPSHQSIHKLKNAIFFCPTAKLNELFQTAIEPIFFGVHPKGKIVAALTNPAYFYRQAFQRALYALANYPTVMTDLAGKDFPGFGTLRHWITAASNELLETILLISAYAFCPFIGHIIGSHALGLKFVFVPENEIKYTPGPFPEGWLDFPRSHADFAMEDYDDISKMPGRKLHGKYVFTSTKSIDERLEFAIWSIKKADELIRLLYDSTNFTVKGDLSVIDPIYALEYGCSIAHVLNLGLSICGNRSLYYNKSTLFQIADILAATAKAGTLGITNEAEFMKDLFKKDSGGKQIIDILTNSNIQGLKQYAKALSDIYDQHEDKIVNSIWYSTRGTSAGISVKDRNLSSDVILTKSEFVGEVTRALRNTHHGYYTRNDPTNRPSRFLSLVTGEISDDAPSMAIGWILALLESRTQVIGNP